MPVYECGGLGGRATHPPLGGAHPWPNGLQVGLTGVVTDFVNVWEQPQNLEKNSGSPTLFRPPGRPAPPSGINVMSAYASTTAASRRNWRRGGVLSDSGENLACKIARELDFDLLLTGHQHMAVEGVELSGTWAVQPPANAGQFLHITGQWNGRGTRFHSRLTPGGVKNTKRSPTRACCPWSGQCRSWLDQPIGELAQPIPPEGKLDAALHGSRVAALFNQVQVVETGADFSCTSLGNDPVGLASPVTMRGVTAAYLFANTLVVLEGDGRGASADPGAVRSLLHPGGWGSRRSPRSSCSPRWSTTITIFTPAWHTPLILRRPVGSRVVRLTKLDGSPLGDGTFRLCTSNYRATGTGGYEILRKCPVLWRGGRGDAGSHCPLYPDA